MKIIAEKEVGVGLDQEQVQIEIEFRCYKCREYDNFAKDVPTTKEEREIEQIQKMFNLNEEQDIIKMLTTDTYGSLKK